MKRKMISTLALTLCVLMTVLCLAACGGSKSALVGTWESVEAPGASITFKADGTGSMDASGISVTFTYEDKDNTVKVINDLNKEQTIVYEYTIDGDKLSLKDKDTETTLTYTKK